MNYSLLSELFPWAWLLGLSFGVCFLSFFSLKICLEEMISHTSDVGLRAANFQNRRISPWRQTYLSGWHDVKNNTEFMILVRLAPLRLASGLKLKKMHFPHWSWILWLRKDTRSHNTEANFFETEGKKNFLNKSYSRKSSEY